MLKYSIMVSCGLRLSCKVMVVMKSTLVKRKSNHVSAGKEVSLGRKTFFRQIMGCWKEQRSNEKNWAKKKVLKEDTDMLVACHHR